MRSIRHRKLMEATRRLLQAEPLTFQFKINEGSSCQCELAIWEEQVLRGLEKGPPVVELLGEFKEWLEMPSEVMGKRSNEIALSKSKRYCLKSISSEDLEQFKTIFPEYRQFKLTQSSILVPFYGVVSIHSTSKANKWEDIFLLMPNLGQGEAVLFDIKGYCEGRFVQERDFKDFRFGKDENFVKSDFLPLLEGLPQQNRRQMLAVIEENVNFLKERGVIDYSLALVFRQRNKSPQESPQEGWISLDDRYEVSMHIIDFLQAYNQRKKLQNKFKSFFFKEISSVQPQVYAQRLIEFMRKALLVK